MLSTAFILGERAVKMYLFLENNKAIVIKTIAEINIKNTVLYSARLGDADRFFLCFFLASCCQYVIHFSAYGISIRTSNSLDISTTVKR